MNNKQTAPEETVINGTLLNPGGKELIRPRPVWQYHRYRCVAPLYKCPIMTIFVTYVGNDVHGRQARQQFEREGVQTNFVITEANEPLPTVEYAIRRSQARAMRVVLNPASTQLLESGVLACRYVITSGETIAELLTVVRVIDEPTACLPAQVFDEFGASDKAEPAFSSGYYRSGGL